MAGALPQLTEFKSGIDVLDRWQSHVKNTLNPVLARQILLNERLTLVSGTTFTARVPFTQIMVWFQGGYIDPSDYTANGPSRTVTFTVPVTADQLACVVLT